MNKNLVATLITLGVGVFLLGIFDVKLRGLNVCEKPYIQSEGSCCLDADENLVCDELQQAGGWGGMDAVIAYNDGTFNVTNSGTASWDNCMAYMDDGWTYRCGYIMPKASFVFGLSDLHGLGGESVPQGYRPGNVTIYSSSGFAFRQLSGGNET